MATIRLIPSTYYLSSSSYLSISNASNMYANTDSTTYGTVTHNRASTSRVYYAYLRGFNFGDVPSNATVTGFTIKLKASATGHTTSTSTSYYMSLYNDTTAIESTTASGRLTTTTTTFTFDNGSMTWEDLKGYGSNFGIRIPLRRASTDTADVVSIYGAEIEVTYTEQTQSVIYAKENGTWKQYSKVYKKTNGTWVQQTDLSNVFDANKKYMKLDHEEEEDTNLLDLSTGSFPYTQNGLTIDYDSTTKELILNGTVVSWGAGAEVPINLYLDGTFTHSYTPAYTNKEIWLALMRNGSTDDRTMLNGSDTSSKTFTVVDNTYDYYSIWCNAGYTYNNERIKLIVERDE